MKFFKTVYILWTILIFILGPFFILKKLGIVYFIVNMVFVGTLYYLTSKKILKTAKRNQDANLEALRRELLLRTGSTLTLDGSSEEVKTLVSDYKGMMPVSVVNIIMVFFFLIMECFL
ncbi:MAG: hypothetical protein HFF09_05975 [Oscillospiraceae bacterium]|nr:hypothetical protein [Oscillospiraceae bacterium]